MSEHRDLQERTPDGRYFVCPQCAKGNKVRLINGGLQHDVSESVGAPSVVNCGFSQRIIEDFQRKMDARWGELTKAAWEKLERSWRRKKGKKP